MKLKTSIAVLTGCLTIFLFLMLPVFLSMKEQKDQSVAAFKGSDFELKDMNNNIITVSYTHLTLPTMDSV